MPGKGSTVCAGVLVSGNTRYGDGRDVPIHQDRRRAPPFPAGSHTRRRTTRIRIRLLHFPTRSLSHSTNRRRGDSPPSDVRESITQRMSCATRHTFKVPSRARRAGAGARSLWPSMDRVPCPMGPGPWKVRRDVSVRFVRRGSSGRMQIIMRTPPLHPRPSRRIPLPMLTQPHIPALPHHHRLFPRPIIRLPMPWAPGVRRGIEGGRCESRKVGAGLGDLVFEDPEGRVGGWVVHCGWRGGWLAGGERKEVKGGLTRSHVRVISFRGT